MDYISLFAAGSDDMASSWGWSEAMDEHKAFQYWAPKKLLAVPLSAYRYTWNNEYDNFMGDFIYTASDRAVTANNLDNMTQTAAIALPGTGYPIYWQSWE